MREGSIEGEADYMYVTPCWWLIAYLDDLLR